MSTVAFLASVVDPRVAASAAKAAMVEFANIRVIIHNCFSIYEIFLIIPPFLKGFWKKIIL